MRAVTYGAAAGLLAIGLAAGGYAVGLATIPAPPECSKAFTAADKALIAYDNAVIVVNLRATRGQSEFAGHDADLNAIWAELDDLKPDYLLAKATCLGADS